MRPQLVAPVVVPVAGICFPVPLGELKVKLRRVGSVNEGRTNKAGVDLQ